MDGRLSTVSLRRLQVFVTVCGTLHMARAAEQLGVAQPALSQQVRGLEQALGVRLFHRRKRGIELSAAGQVCRAEAEKLLALHASTIEAVRRAARGETGRITLGYVGSAMFERRFPAQLKTMQATFPDVALSLREGSVAALLAALDAGELDAALVRAPVKAEPPLVQRFHSRQELVAILPTGHRLAGARAIAIAELAAEPLIGLSDPDDVGIMQVATRMAEAAGMRLQVKWQVSEVASILGMVAAGLGYGIVPRDLALLAGPDILMRALDDPAARAELRLVWHAQRTTPALERFIEVLAPQRKASAGRAGP